MATTVSALADVLGLAEEAIDLAVEQGLPRALAAILARSSRARSARRRVKRRSLRPGLARAEQLALAAELEVALGELEAVGRRDERLEPRRAMSVSSSFARETSRQYDCSAPRPTRPRSWWSWARPKRSASWTIMIVAFGTSTPTSITVVATRTSISPRVEARHDARGARPASAARAGSRSVTRELGAAQPLGLVLGRPRERRLGRLDQRADDVRLAARVEMARAAARTPRTLRSSPTHAVTIGCGSRAASRSPTRRGRRRPSARACAGSASPSCAARAAAAFGERAPLLDAEAVLLVDDRDGEVGELDLALDQRVRADGDVRLAARGAAARRVASRRARS